MADDDKQFEIAIDGTRVKPSTVRLRDLYDVLHAFEMAVVYTAQRSTDLHLLNIKEGSADCLVGIEPSAYGAAVQCARAIQLRDLSGLPAKARDSLMEIRSKTRSKGWTVKVGDGNGMPRAEITPTTEFVTDAAISGFSELACRLVRVGGTPNPTASIITTDQRRLTASIASEQLAIELAALLYRTISVQGEATWSGPSLSLTDFRITGIGDFDDRANIMDTLNELRDIAGDFWNDIDPDEYIASQRAESY